MLLGYCHVAVLLQESNALLIDSEHKSQLSSIAKREKCQVDFVGEITGTGKVGYF